jgi:hypothetical protein
MTYVDSLLRYTVNFLMAGNSHQHENAEETQRFRAMTPD